MTKMAIKKNPGFLLIEIVVGMAIAMAISLLLINTLHQTQKARTSLDDYVYVYTQAAIINHQLERDLTTAFAPNIILVPTEKIPTTSPTPNSQAKKPETDKTQETDAKKANNKTEKEKKEKTLEKLFYTTEKNKNLDLL